MINSAYSSRRTNSRSACYRLPRSLGAPALGLGYKVDTNNPYVGLFHWHEYTTMHLFPGTGGQPHGPIQTASYSQ
jgi:hypothetical protein